MRRQYPSCRARRVQVPVQGPGPGPARVQAQARGREKAGRQRQLEYSRYEECQGQHSTALHSIYRAVRVDGSHNDNTHGQILINLRRLGHQIKPAKSWLPFLERMLLEGLHCPEH